MRRSLSACRSGLTVAAAAVLLTACGGSDGEESAASESSASSSSAAETTSTQADSQFCTEAAGALEQVEPAFTGSGNDPAALATALQAAADDVRAIEPPSEIESDWTALADGIEQFAQAFAGVDLQDPASATQLQQRTTEIIGSLSTSATNVQTYLATECGLEVDATEPAAPTS
jgi:Flp pilus assembly protein TadD